MADDAPRLAWCPECQEEADYDMHPIYAGGRIPRLGSGEAAIDWNARCTRCLSSIEWRPYQNVPLDKRLTELRAVRMPDEPDEDD